jgi:hypothetical protein
VSPSQPAATSTNVESHGIIERNDMNHLRLIEPSVAKRAREVVLVVGKKTSYSEALVVAGAVFDRGFLGVVVDSFEASSEGRKATASITGSERDWITTAHESGH